MADDLFRAWLTGISSEDATDTARPVGCRVALVEWIREDTSTGVSAVPIKGVARVLLPNGAGCPLYAADLHLFGTVALPAPVLPATTYFNITNAPRVLIRRDVTSSTVGGETCCYHTVISPTFVVRLNNKWNSASDGVAPGEFAELTFFDPQGNTFGGKLGHVSSYSSALALSPTGKVARDSLVIATMLTSQGLTVPFGTHAWSVLPAGPLGGTTVAPVRFVSGTGASYVINVFANGPLQPATLLNQPCTQLQVAGTETIPANTWAIGMQIGGAWYTQVPVWL